MLIGITSICVNVVITTSVTVGIIAGITSVRIVLIWVLKSAAGLLVSVEDSNELALGLALGVAVLGFLRGGPFGGIPVNKYALGHHSITMYTKVRIKLKHISRLYI